MADGDHTGEEVMHGTGENGTEGDPQEHHGAPESTGKSTEDGAEASNVQELDKEKLPLGKNHVVHTVVDGNGGSFAIVRAKGVFHHLTIRKIADDEDRKAKEETKHTKTSLDFAETVHQEQHCNGLYFFLVILSTSKRQGFRTRKTYQAKTKLPNTAISYALNISMLVDKQIFPVPEPFGKTC